MAEQSFTGLRDMFDGGGPGQSGDTYSGGPFDGVSFGGGGGGNNTSRGNNTSGGSKNGGLFESLGAIVGMVAMGGNPVGAMLGSGLGSLLSGGNMQQAINSGVSSLATGALMGNAGLALNALGGGSPSQRGERMMSSLSSPQGQQQALKTGLTGAIGGGPTGALRGIMQGTGITDVNGKMDPLMGGIMMELLNQQRRPRFENVMTDTEMRQYETGERNPDYQGTAARKPINYRPRNLAEGGYIEGPGTGKSDSIDAAIYQNGGRVQEARLSDGEFVMTADAVRGAGGGDRDAGAAKMYQMMNQFERRA